MTSTESATTTANRPNATSGDDVCATALADSSAATDGSRNSSARPTSRELKLPRSGVAFRNETNNTSVKANAPAINPSSGPRLPDQ